LVALFREATRSASLTIMSDAGRGLRTRTGGPPDPAYRAKPDGPLLTVTLVACLSSISALLLQWVGWIRMPYTISFFSLPGMVTIVALTVWTKRTGRQLFFNRLWVGTVGAALGLVGYDLVRWLVQVALPVNFDAFAAFPAFGHYMTGRPPSDHVAIAAGWAYHITNGWTFGIIYALLAGPARWWWGLVWGATLEAAMMIVYPTLLHPRSVSSFVIVSVIGHAVFGSIVGITAQRRAIAARA
jgi:hypothetical protein